MRWDLKVAALGRLDYVRARSAIPRDRSIKHVRAASEQSEAHIRNDRPRVKHAFAGDPANDRITPAQFRRQQPKINFPGGNVIC